MLGRTGKCAWLFVVLHLHCQLSSFVLFSRGVVFTNTVMDKRRRRDDDDGRLFVRSKRNPKEKGATMAPCLVCVKEYKGERRRVLGVRSQREGGKVPL